MTESYKNMVLSDDNGNLASIQFPRGIILMWNADVNRVAVTTG
jgi:hypothetical protein